MCGNDRWSLNVACGFMPYRYMAIDRRNLSTTLPCEIAVRGTMKFSKDVRAAEVNGGHPRFFMVTITLLVDEDLGFTAV
jgi:hypothetical protein